MRKITKIRTGRTYQILSCTNQKHLIGHVVKVIARNGIFLTVVDFIGGVTSNSMKRILQVDNVTFVSASKNYVEKSKGAYVTN